MSSENQKTKNPKKTTTHPKPQWVQEHFKKLKCCQLAAFYGGVRASKGKLGHTFSEAKFKMQVPAEQLKFDLVNSLGLRACSQTLWSLHRASPQPTPDWPPRHTSPAWRSLALNLGAKKRESSQDTGCQHVGKFDHRASLFAGLPALQAALSHPRRNSHSVSFGFMTVLFKVKFTEH